MPRIFDNNGRLLNAAETRDLFRQPRHLGQTADDAFSEVPPDTTSDQTVAPAAPAPAASEGSFGASIWAFFHPQQVQAEYQAVGKTAPPITDIMGGALTDMGDFASQGVTDVVTGAQTAAAGVETLVRIALVAGVLAGGFVLYRKLVK